MLHLSHFFELPLQGLELVVDRARSPADPVSFRKQHKTSKKCYSRSFSWDSSCRWSSTPASRKANNESSLKKSESSRDMLSSGKTAMTLNRALSLHNSISDLRSESLRIPRRHQSPVSSPKRAISRSKRLQEVTRSIKPCSLLSSMRKPIRRSSRESVSNAARPEVLDTGAKMKKRIDEIMSKNTMEVMNQFLQQGIGTTTSSSTTAPKPAAGEPQPKNCSSSSPPARRGTKSGSANAA